MKFIIITNFVTNSTPLHNHETITEILMKYPVSIYVPTHEVSRKDGLAVDELNRRSSY